MLTSSEHHHLGKPAQLLEELCEPRALNHKHSGRVQLAARTHHVRLDVRGQAWGTPGGEAADQGAIQVQQDTQLVLGRGAVCVGWGGGARKLRKEGIGHRHETHGEGHEMDINVCMAPEIQISRHRV